MTRLAAVPTAPLRAVELIRVSRAREEMTSPELQKTANADYCAARNYRIVRTLEGLDESGSRSRSSWWVKLDEAIALIESGDADVIVAWKFSRVARHRLRWAVAVDRVETAGGRIEASTEPIDATTSAGRFARGMLSEYAAFQADQIGEQWRETHDRRRRHGLPHGGGPRFGYTQVGGRYVPDPETAPVVVELYRRYLSGDGLLALVRWLNARGLTTTAGHPWSSARIGPFLDSGFAAGLLRRTKSTGEYLPGAHEAIIDRATWEAYLRRRAAQRHVPARVRQPTYELTGLARCGLCGAPLATQRGSGKTAYLYVCSRWHTSRACPGVWVTRGRVERETFAWLAQFASDIEARAAARVGHRKAGQLARLDARQAARQVRQIDERLEKLTLGWTSGLVPDVAYAATRDELQLLHNEARRELEKAQALAATPAPTPPSKTLLDSWGTTLPVKARRDILATFLERVEVWPTEGRGRPRVVPVPHLWITSLL